MAVTLTDHPAQQTPIGKKLYTCAVCHKSYARADRLKRHSLSHATGGSEHKCQHCSKGFTRKDVLKRHEQAHLHVREDGSASFQAHSSVLRTCVACRRARARCLGGQPCSYCSTRKQTCIYPLRKSRSRRLHQQPDATSPASVVADADTVEHQTQESFDEDQLHEATHTDGFDLTSAQSTLTPAGGEKGSDALSNSAGRPVIACLSPGTQETLSWQPELDIIPSVDDAGGADVSEMDRINWLCFDDSLSFTDLSMPLYDHVITDLDTAVHEPDLMISDPAAGESDRFHPGTILSQAPVIDSPLSDGLPPPSVASGASRRSAGRASGLVRTSRGSLYTDGQGARSSTVDRRRSFRESIMSPAASAESHKTSFANFQDVLDEKSQQMRLGNIVTYELAAHVLADVGINCAAHVIAGDYPVLSLAKLGCLIDHNILQWFIQLCLDHFDSAHPFVDRFLLQGNAWSWALCMAMAAIGAGYAGSSQFALCGEALAQMVGDCLGTALAANPEPGALPCLMAQTLLTLRLGNSQQASNQEEALGYSSILYRRCLQLRLLEDKVPDFAAANVQVEEAWLAWREREASRRTGIMIWMLDFAQSNALSAPSHIPLDRVLVRAPCSEALWEAGSAHEWHSTYYGDTDLLPLATDFFDEERSRPRLQAVQEQLWTQLRAPEVTSPFALAHIVCMLVRRVQDALNHFTHAPRLTILGSTETALSKLYPPAEATFSKWRNTACDCLDVLHWEASCVAAKEAGFESPLFLHLHLARLLTLSPVEDLCNIAHAHCLSRSSSAQQQTYLGRWIPVADSHRMLRIWANTDRYKARLAMVHAGATFWHARRYSSDVLMQPFTIYLATLVLWAYGTFHGSATQSTQCSDQRPAAPTDSQQQQALLSLSGGVTDTANAPRPTSATDTPSNASSTKPRRMPRWIQLDRPVDDELVQHFIRTGDMRVVLECIDDLCAPNGPRDILAEGAALLDESATIWTISQQYAAELRCMIQGGQQSRSSE